MNTSCYDAYNIFCKHNKGENFTKVQYVLNVVGMFKKKLIISHTELDFLLHYIQVVIGGKLLTEYEQNILIMALSELKITDMEGNNEVLNHIFYCITKQFKSLNTQ